MPLLDHFHRPLKSVSVWSSFHHAWLAYQASDMRPFLPPRCYVEPGTRLGIEIDVAALERLRDRHWDPKSLNWESKWAPPEPGATVPCAVATDEQEILIIDDGAIDGLRVVGAIELLSPSNKHRPDNREAFVSKCHAYLQRGIGVVLVDTVTEALFNLHNELMDRLEVATPRLPGHLYATSYRPLGNNADGRLDLWLYPLAVGEKLPTVPLWLYGGICVPVRLEEGYERTCLELQIAERLTEQAEIEAARAAANGRH